MEKINLVGGNQEDKKEVGKMLDSDYEEFEFQKAEIEPTNEQREETEKIIKDLEEFLNSYTNNSISFDINRIHIVDIELLPNEEKKILKNSHGGFNSMTNRILLFKEKIKDIEHFKKILCHELIHSISFNSLTVKSGDFIEVFQRRLGLEIVVEEKNALENYFKSLNEALTEILTEKFLVFFNQKRGLKNKNTVDGYKKEKELLNTIIEVIFEKNKDKFENKEEIFKVFVKAMIEGRLLEIARLIEKSFEKGFFRKLGELTK